MNYDNEPLMLSGIQHMAFCERQWALIHIEQQWVENVRTLEGKFLHEQADDPFFSEWRNSVLTIRSVPLKSEKLGLIGRADVVELVSKEQSIKHSNPGIGSKSISDLHYEWQSLRPVEYKRGKPKPDDRDQVQLCAQAICLEEMNNTHIAYGYLFYGEIRRRDKVEFTIELRRRVEELAEKMHQYFNEAYTPLPFYKSHCKACSLVDICIPSPITKAGSVNKYLSENL